MDYLHFDNDSSLYEALNLYLNQGYTLKSPSGLSPVLTDGKKELTLLFHEKPEEKELWMPDFNDTFLNVISTIRKNFGYDSEREPSFELDKKYKKVIILLLDGMGINIMKNNLEEDSFLRTHLYKSIHAVYPSTTAAATTAIKCGLSPLESGWTGWENWFSEISQNVVLFNGKNNITGEKTDITGFKVMPYTPFWKDMETVKGYVVEPDFSKENQGLADVLNRSLQLNGKDECQIQYVYHTNPDELMHEAGAYADSVKSLLRRTDKMVSDYASKLSSDTLLIIRSWSYQCEAGTFIYE